MHRIYPPDICSPRTWSLELTLTDVVRLWLSDFGIVGLLYFSSYLFTQADEIMSSDCVPVNGESRDGKIDVCNVTIRQLAWEPIIVLSFIMHANSKLICSAWRLREMLLQELLVLEFSRIEYSIHLSANRTHQRFKGATFGEVGKGSEPTQHFDCPIVDRIFIDPTPPSNCGQSSCLYGMFFLYFRWKVDYFKIFVPTMHHRVVHGSDGPAGRVGSGRIGSGRVKILPDFGGSGRVSTSNFKVFYWLFLGTWIDMNLRLLHSDWLIFYDIQYTIKILNNK